MPAFHTPPSALMLLMTPILPRLYIKPMQERSIDASRRPNEELGHIIPSLLDYGIHYYDNRPPARQRAYRDKARASLSAFPEMPLGASGEKRRFRARAIGDHTAPYIF